MMVLIFSTNYFLYLCSNASISEIRCCEYALLILEYWADAPEIQRSADLYEDLIRCCVADAMSEVSTSLPSHISLYYNLEKSVLGPEFIYVV